MSAANPTRLELLRWQFDFVWALTEVHLTELLPEDFLFEPAPTVWTMHRAEDGSWTPDWADVEPHPIPVPTGAWISWHLGWWWNVAADHLQGRTPREREHIAWPGPERATAWLRQQYEQWIKVLDGLTDAALDGPSAYPWPAGTNLTVAHQLAWVNAELLKNVAELGQLRLLRAVTPK